MGGSLKCELLDSPRAKALFPTAFQATQQGVAEGVAPGMVAAIWRADAPRVFQAWALGQRRTHPQELPALPMAVDTLFDFASVTKVFATATLVARLVDRGWLEWRTPLKAILPQFQESRVTLEHLLAHTAGLPAWAPLYSQLRERAAGHALHQIPVARRQAWMREGVLEASNAAGPVPGERAVYSDLSYLLLGFVLEEVTGRDLDRAVQQLLWNPMGIERSFFRRTTESVLEARDERFAATEVCPWRGGVIQGQVHDDNCWAMGGYGGHAGALGPVSDLMLFGSSLVQGFLSPSVLARAWTRVRPPVGPPGCERTPGWDTPSGETPSFSRRFSDRSVGHLGFTGTSLWIDPSRGWVISLLTNRVHPARENWGIRAFRPRFHAALAEDLRA